ncbi:MAG: pyrroloquinoline quinone biosynthesis peptide chaperone PqqD [Rhodobacterales bacterium]|nr:pyrroloquinoline quinone biosynthesis peptide chaperone PqqD [Rhodobacterales bacterium]
MAIRHMKLEAGTRPILPRHVRLKFDKLRERWLLLAPERILIPDPIAVKVLQMCDGERSVAALIAELAGIYDAPESQIGQDVTVMLQELADKGFLTEIKETAQ